MGNHELQETFLPFREQCIWLQICFNMYAELYESGDETSAALFNSTLYFFADLNNILRPPQSSFHHQPALWRRALLPMQFLWLQMRQVPCND
jgi:hypothetical protein